MKKVVALLRWTLGLFFSSSACLSYTCEHMKTLGICLRKTKNDLQFGVMPLPTDALGYED